MLIFISKLLSLQNHQNTFINRSNFVHPYKLWYEKNLFEKKFFTTFIETNWQVTMALKVKGFTKHTISDIFCSIIKMRFSTVPRICKLNNNWTNVNIWFCVIRFFLTRSIHLIGEFFEPEDEGIFFAECFSPVQFLPLSQ